jgi:hypothetical protein
MGFPAAIKGNEQKNIMETPFKYELLIAESKILAVWHSPC